MAVLVRSRQLLVATEDGVYLRTGSINPKLGKRDPDLGPKKGKCQYARHIRKKSESFSVVYCLRPTLLGFFAFPRLFCTIIPADLHFRYCSCTIDPRILILRNLADMIGME